MLASQTINNEIAKEVVSIRSMTENAYREILSIHPTLKRHASLIESFGQRLNEVAFLLSLEEKFKLLSVSLDERLYAFSWKIDSFLSEMIVMRKSLADEKCVIDSLKEEFSKLCASSDFFRKTIENILSLYGSQQEQKIEDSKKKDEKLRKDLEGLFLIKDEETNQIHKDLTSKIMASSEDSKSLLEEMRRLKVAIRVLENNFATLKNKEKG